MAKKPAVKSSSTPPKPTLPAPPVPHWRVPTAVWLGLLAALALLLRWKLLAIPLERDESAYAYLGQRLLEGLAPYRDFYEMKPPFLFAAYAFTNTVFGYSQEGLRWAALAFTLLNAGLIFGLGRRLLGADVWAFAAAVAYLMLTASPYASAMLLESELIVMAAVLGGLLLLLRWRDHYGTPAQPGGHWWLVGSGALVATGVLVKQTGLVFLGIPALVLLWAAVRERRVVWPFLLKHAAWYALGVALPVLLCAAWMLAAGTWNEFWFWNVTYPGQYTSTITGDLAKATFNANIKMLTDGFTWYWVLGGVGLALLLAKGLSMQNRLIVLALAVLGFVSVTPGKRFYGHYWLQFLPALALLIAVVFQTADHWLRGRGRAVLAGLAVVALLVPAVNFGRLWLNQPPGKVVNAVFPGNPYAEDAVLADFLQKRLQPGEQVAVLGSEPQFYVYLNQKAPSRHFYAALLSRPSDQNTAWQQEAFEALRDAHPKYVVFPQVPFSWMLKEKGSKLLFEQSYYYLRNGYKPIAYADILSNSEARYILDPAQAATYKPTGKQYLTVWERVDANPANPPAPPAAQ